MTEKQQYQELAKELRANLRKMRKATRRKMSEKDIIALYAEIDRTKALAEYFEDMAAA